MTTKNFNAKKMLMSTLAVVVFSFVFTTSADAGTTPFKRVEAHKCYVEAHKCHKCSNDKKQEQKQEEDDSNKGFITYFLEKVLGIK